MFGKACYLICQLTGIATEGNESLLSRIIAFLEALLQNFSPCYLLYIGT